MAAFLVIFIAGLCGYFRASLLAWPAMALSLLLLSWAEHYLLARRTAEIGFAEVVQGALLRSSINALASTGACYWSGVAIRHLSGL